MLAIGRGREHDLPGVLFLIPQKNQKNLPLKSMFIAHLASKTKKLGALTITGRTHGRLFRGLTALLMSDQSRFPPSSFRLHPFPRYSGGMPLEPRILKLAELKPGMQADCFVRLSAKDRATTRDGKPYYRVAFCDAGRSAVAMVWSDSPWFESCE